jgi:anaerobic selenocysteine-containing dehydrogenase
MADEMRDSLGSDLSRREFVSLSVAASLAAAAGASAAAQAKVTETDV